MQQRELHSKWAMQKSSRAQHMQKGAQHTGEAAEQTGVALKASERQPTSRMTGRPLGVLAVCLPPCRG